MAPLKVCGLTRFADVALCLRLGATYLGAIVDIPRSPRCLTWEQARLLLRAARGRGVAVVEEPEPQRVVQLVEEAHLAAVQLHGHGDGGHERSVEAMRSCLAPPTEVWAVLGLPVEPREAEAELPVLLHAAERLAGAGADRIVLDSRVKGQSGGTGLPGNWEHAARIVAASAVPVLLAGGIKPGNAAEALRVSGAIGLDACSGVESRPGVKDPRAVAELVREVSRAETQSEAS